MSVIISLVDGAIRLLELAIVVRVLFSWINPNPYNPIVAFIHRITDPILEPLQRVIPLMGPLDITPMVAVLLLEVARSILTGLLTSLVP